MSAAKAAVINQMRSAFNKNYIDITKRRQDTPDIMKAFSALAQAAGRDGALDKKELIAIATAISAFTWMRWSGSAPPARGVGKDEIGLLLHCWRLRYAGPASEPDGLTAVYSSF